MKILYKIYLLLVFITSMVIIVPLIIVISLFKSKTLITNIIKYWSKYFLFMIGMPVTIIGALPKGKFIYVGNHISYLDSLVMFSIIKTHFRALGQMEFSKKPIIGFIYKQIAIMVDRSSPESRTKSISALWKQINNGVSILLFPEGKFNTTNEVLLPFYDGAFKLAINTQTPILPFVLLDTVDRWHFGHWLSFTPGKNRIIILEPVSTEGMDMSNLEGLKQTVFNSIELKLKKK